MSGAEQSRAGIPISAKLVFATSVVVAAVVGVASWFSAKTIDELTATQISVRRAATEKSITRDSELITQSVANGVAHAIAETRIPDIKPVLDAALADDKASGDKRVNWMVVIDGSGQEVGSTDGAPAGPKLAEFEKLLAAAPKTGEVVHARIGTGSDYVYGSPTKIGTTVVGSVRVGVSTASLDAELSRALADSDDRARASRQRVLLVSLIVLGIGIVLAALQGVQLAKPIKELTQVAQRIAEGDLESRVPEGRRDELGTLARTFNFMTHQIITLLNEQATKLSLEKEMDLARQVQQAMIPPGELDQHGPLKFVGYCMPASQCGGDWWMYRKMPNGRLLLVLGDATGHGIHSAMIAATARGAVEALAGVDERLLEPDQILRAIDQAIRMVGDTNVRMTAFAAVIDSQSGVLHYANAGQNFPYVMRVSQQRRLEDANVIAASGSPLGDRNVAVEIKRGQQQLSPGDLFVVFTDGVVERSNAAGKQFGDRRLRSTLTGQALSDGQSLVDLRDHIIGTVEQYAEGTFAEDDVTLVLCQFDPRPTQSRVRRGVA